MKTKNRKQLVFYWEGKGIVSTIMFMIGYNSVLCW